MKITILGCGPSYGVPSASGNWGECDPGNIKNYRTRSSILIEHKNKYLLIDTSPDLRKQSIDNKITNIDEVLITHTHFDHIAGFNDLKAFKLPIKVYCPKYFEKSLISMFGYVALDKTIIDLRIFDHKEFQVETFTHKVIPIKQIHGQGLSYGFRISNFAYCVDLSEFSNNEIEKLIGVKLLIIACINYRDHKAHAGYYKVKEWIDIINPERVILTHMSNKMNYIERIDSKIELAYDSMTIDADFL